jgi:hypothetical protein
MTKRANHAAAGFEMASFVVALAALAATLLPGALTWLLTCVGCFSTLAAMFIKWRRGWLALEEEACRIRHASSIEAAQRHVLEATKDEMYRRVAEMSADQLLVLWSSLTRNEHLSASRPDHETHARGEILT